MARTDNYSIRFDEDKLAFFKEKNPKLEKPQEIIDFFLDEFFWKHHFGSNPVLERQENKQEVIEELKEEKPKGEKLEAPNPKDKAAYLRWLKEN